jgi:hypothetical protein
MNTRTQIVIAALIGQLIGPLGYIDSLYVVIVLAAPLVVGGLAATRGFPLATVLVLWFSTGINMLVVDWIRYQEDAAFHAVLSVVMSLLAAAGFGLVRLVSRARSSRGAERPATSATVR